MPLTSMANETIREANNVTFYEYSKSRRFFYFVSNDPSAITERKVLIWVPAEGTLALLGLLIYFCLLTHIFAVCVTALSQRFFD